jgi:hypothetical protein
MKIIGIILIVIGVIGLASGGLSWTRREKVADLGPIEVTRSERKTLPLPPLAGGACLAAGVVVLMASRRTSGR